MIERTLVVWESPKDGGGQLGCFGGWARLRMGVEKTFLGGLCCPGTRAADEELDVNARLERAADDGSLLVSG